ncbi:MAG: FG-GAP-like repeat-containing protein, partial [Bacteroidota bacterium]
MKKIILLYFLLLTGSSIYSQTENEIDFQESNKGTFTYKKIDVINSTQATIPLEGVSSKKDTNVAKNNTSGGVGETSGSLSVSLTGASNYTVPFLVPPGINNISPKIALSYNSQSGNGIAGYGWNISGISMISRTSATKYHDGEIDGIDFDNLDRFALDGQRLMLKSGTYGATGAQYETENYSNLKIVSYGVSPYGANYGPEYFVVFYPNGSKAYYGNSSDSRTHTGYAITHWENSQGVRIDYEYSTTNKSQSISKIKYGHTNTTTPVNEVRFLYYPTIVRNRWEKSYVGNIPLTRKNVLRSVEAYANNNRVRSYSFGYDPSYLSYDRLLFLREYTGDLQEAHSAIFFEYTKSNTSVTVNDITTDLGVVNIEQRNTETVTMDFTGNGKMDFLVYPKDDKRKFWLFKDIQSGTSNSPTLINTGAFEEIFPAKWVNHENRVVEGQGITMVKKGNSGRIRFEVYANSSLQPMLLNYSKEWNSGTYTYQSDCNNSSQRDIPKEYISGDFNGDGLTDVLAVGKPYSSRYCYEYECPNGQGDDNGIFFENRKPIQQEDEADADFEKRKKAYEAKLKENTLNRSTTIDPQPIDVIDPDPGNTGACCSCSNYTIQNKTVSFIDLNRNVTTNFAFTAGYLLETLGEEDRLSTGDFNGDGKSDFVHVANGKLTIYTLDNNNQLSVLWSITDAGINTTDPLLFGDFNGDGKTDFLDPVANGSYSFRTFISTGTTFVQETVVQPFKYQKTTYQPSPIPNYSVFNGYNLIPLDINGDGKTDIIEYNTTTYNNGLNGVQTVKIYNNQGQSSNHPNADVRFLFGGTATKNGNAEHFPIPIFLTSNQPNKNLDFATISNQWVTSFSFTQDHREDMLLRSVDNNGVKYTIEYEHLDPSGNSQIYSASNSSTYPNVDIKTAPGTKVVSSLQRIVAGTPTLTKTYAYEGAVYNVEGLGFLGFNGVARSNWHTGSSDRIYTVSKYDPLLRGAMIASYSQANYYTFTIPTSNYISKTTYQYNSSIAANKVFKISTTSVLTQNNLDGTYTNTMYQYDVFNNPTHISTNYVGGSTARSITYANSTGANYYIGRQMTVAETSTIGSDTYNSEQQFVYTGNLVTQKKTKGNGTPFDVETYGYDTFGNITKITTTPNGES